MRPRFAVIIPALNEEQHIETALKAVSDLDSFAGVSGEVIVVDNGSTDRTVEIAQELGARVILLPRVTISSLRNRGVSETTAEVLCFLDADCEVTRKWKEALRNLLAEDPGNLVTGSYYSSPPQMGWLARTLESRPRSCDITHLPSGNLVVTRDVFDRVGGFDPRLSTGEDYDFCQRAMRANATFERRPEFMVYHHGYPRTLRQYFQRERWHGRGDYESFRAFHGSRPAQFALLHILSLIAAALVGLLYSWLWAAMIYVVLAIIPVLGIAWMRSHGSLRLFAANVLLFWLYTFSRGISLFDVLLSRTSKRRWR